MRMQKKTHTLHLKHDDRLDVAQRAQILNIILTNCLITDVRVIYYNNDGTVIKVLLPSFTHVSVNTFSYDLVNEFVDKGNYIAFNFNEGFKKLDDAIITIKYSEA